MEQGPDFLRDCPDQHTMLTDSLPFGAICMLQHLRLHLSMDHNNIMLSHGTWVCDPCIFSPFT
jgi:hypothetical protein